MSLGLHILEGFSIIGVNVFILITGHFSVTLKKSSLINLAFICLFWAIIEIACRITCGVQVTFKHLFFITSSSWFIPCYIGLLFLTPILNVFCDKVSKKTLWGVVLALLLIEIWFDWLPPCPGIGIGTNYGYSVLSFAILYLLARAIRLYGLPQWFKGFSPLIYIVCSLSLGLLAHYSIKTNLEYNISEACFTYNNPIVILSAVSFMLMFEQVQIQSKSINHIAKSTLAILLGQNAIFFLYTKQFKYLFEYFTGFQLVAYWSLAVIIVFCSSVIVDQLRLVLYKPIDKLLKARITDNILFGAKKDS
jgi:hypothetical protein